VRIVVTGVAGFVGFHVAGRLLAEGHQILGIDEINAYYDPSLKEARLRLLSGRPGYEFVQMDVADQPKLLERIGPFTPNVIVHLAAQAGVRYSLENPQAYTHANINGFLSVLEACRALKPSHLVYASSSSVYGANTKVPFAEEDRVDGPVSLYAATKRANELMGHTYAHLFGIKTTGLRFFTVYGPWGRPDMAYFKFTKAILEGKPIDVYDHGRMSRDFTYIDDIVNAIAKLVALPFEGEGVPHRIYNIGNHTPVQLEYFISVIERAVDRKATKRYLPMQPGDVPATYADVTALAKLVGFAPKTTIEDGIERFVRWYRDYYSI
jgi:UDP-glucuronate 4-epimerase